MGQPSNGSAGVEERQQGEASVSAAALAQQPVIRATDPAMYVTAFYTLVALARSSAVMQWQWLTVVMYVYGLRSAACLLCSRRLRNELEGS